MSDLPCLDLDILFSSSSDKYKAQVVQSPAGDGQQVSFHPRSGTLS